MTTKFLINSYQIPTNSRAPRGGGSRGAPRGGAWCWRGGRTETRMVLDGNLTALVDHNLKMNCANKAMTGFNMVNYKNVYAAYKYTCDTGEN